MKFLAQMLHNHKRKKVKKFWEGLQTKCPNAYRIYGALDDDYRGTMSKILEFGCSWGGNLEYFMQKLPDLKTVGVDINKNVFSLVEKYPNFTAVNGDESCLKEMKTNEFDLAFTISVLDHVPYDYVVEDIIDELIRISRKVILLEPYIEGVHGDVSNKTRCQVKPSLEKGYKLFAQYSYVWDYDTMLNKKNVQWSKVLMKLHDASLGPFYHLYVIESDTARL